MSMSETAVGQAKAGSTCFLILGAVSLCHLLNDLMQSLLPAVYPVLKAGFGLSYTQIGFLTLAYQITASLLQPLVGLCTDRRPMPHSLLVAMALSLAGVVALAFAPTYWLLLVGGMLLGFGSSVFHPVSSRIAHSVSGDAPGLGQSLFQVGGNLGASLGPLLAAVFVLPRGQGSLAWFAFAALGGMACLLGLERRFARQGRAFVRSRATSVGLAGLTGPQVRRAMVVLAVLVASKYLYLASIASYYAFYLMHRFGLAATEAQLCLSVFLAFVAAGTIVGGPIGDRIGRKAVIWASIAGVLPFTLALPYVGLPATVGLSAIIGLMLSSAFPAIVVHAQELAPGRVGTVSGVFFGLAFGVGGIGAAGLGVIADRMGIDFVYEACSFLPLTGLLAVFLPNAAPEEGRVERLHRSWTGLASRFCRRSVHDRC